MLASPPETRASLILRLQDGDDVAVWEEFVRIYSPVVRRVAIHQGFQAADADDVVQEVLLSVARSVTAWLERTDRGSFRAWLLRIARNRAIRFVMSWPIALGNRSGLHESRGFPWKRRLEN